MISDCGWDCCTTGVIWRELVAALWAVVIVLVASDGALAQARGPQIVTANYVVGKGPSAKIVNGSPTTWYPTVGELLYGRNGDFSGWCTATLIGCSTALTAAHCIADDTAARNYLIFFQHGGIDEVTSIGWLKNDYQAPTASNGSRADIAVLKLRKPINGIARQPINDDREHAANLKGTIVGFGRTGGAAENYGLKRFGEVTAARCSNGYQQPDLVCWNYRGHDESNTCNGDSGGPLFLSEGRPREVVSGVTSGGKNEACLAIDHSFDTSVFRYRSWIKSVAGSDLGLTSCGPQPRLSDTRDRYRSFSGQMDDGTPMHVFEVGVTGVQELRVGVNVGSPLNVSQTPVVARPQLFIVSGKSRGDTANALCTSRLEAPVAFCAVATPPDGVYTIVLNRAANEGRADFQLVMSVF
jgi:hypothetical protein